MRIGYIPCKDEKEARRVAGLLLKRRLIACANILPITSVYKWKGKITDTAEAALIIKTTAAAWKDAKRLIEDEHSYECPCILCFDADANKAFREWAASWVGGRRRTRP